jgi:hypothetical protein
VGTTSIDIDVPIISAGFTNIRDPGRPLAAATRLLLRPAQDPQQRSENGLPARPDVAEAEGSRLVRALAI